MAPGPSFYIVYNLIYLLFHHHYFSGHFALFHPFHHTINRFVFCETGEIDNLSAVGGKVFWLSVCRSASVEGQVPEIFNIHLVIDFKSYWFDKPRFN